MKKKRGEIMAETELRPPFAEADWATKIEYLNENDNFYYSDGIELVELSPGYAHMIMPVKSRHLNSQGNVHGGWTAALIGQAAGKAALSYGYFVTPEQLSMNYHNDCSGGVLHAYAREKNRGKHLGIYTVDVQNESGDLVVSGTVTLYIQDKLIDFPQEKRDVSEIFKEN
jgi:uncharacterized protein (TIGR00369 family)